MKKVIVILGLVLVGGLAKAQNIVLWKDHNVIFEQKEDDYTGNSTYSIYAKESKYQEMYYLLTVSTGSLEKVYQDVQLMSKMCISKKGVFDQNGERDIASRDVRSVFVMIKGDVGYALLEHHELKKVSKIIEKKADEIGIVLADDDKVSDAK